MAIIFFRMQALVLSLLSFLLLCSGPLAQTQQEDGAALCDIYSQQSAAIRRR